MTGIAADKELVQSIEQALKTPVYFRDILSSHARWPYRSILRAWSEVREKHELQRDEFGRYWRKLN